ncbi:MAG TPA: shikimate kinase [Xanthomonadaceae bacterium]|nr:shikimate kinase [Xanthomonadaceae bacterium]
MNPAPNLVLVGPMGSGKTSIGRRLAERFALAFVDADREIEAQAGASIATIFDCEGEAGFRARERATLARLLDGEGQVLATGGGAVLDAGTRGLLRARGFVVHLQVSVDGQLQRLSRDRVRPLLQQGDRAQVLQALAQARAPLYAEVADLVFDTEGLAAGDAARTLVVALQGAWKRGAAA